MTRSSILDSVVPESHLLMSIFSICFVSILIKKRGVIKIAVFQNVFENKDSCFSLKMDTENQNKCVCRK